MGLYEQEDIEPGELARMRASAVAFTQDVRELVSATVLTEVDDAELARAAELVRAATEILRQRHLDGSFGVRFNSDGTRRSWGNAVVGARNPLAPPVEFTFADKSCWAEVELGAAYEGPPGLVHGGMIAMILDQALGAAADHAGVPGMTGTLTTRYRRATPLGRIRIDATLDRVEGVKSICTGTISTAEGVCAEAEGIFILPRWAREEVGDHRWKSVGEA